MRPQVGVATRELVAIVSSAVSTTLKTSSDYSTVAAMRGQIAFFSIGTVGAGKASRDSYDQFVDSLRLAQTPYTNGGEMTQ
jgi:hypothetical protein